MKLFILLCSTYASLKCSGFTTNGEWNSLRTKGNTRPLSVLQIRNDVNSKYSRMKKQDLVGMLTPVCKFTIKIVCS